MAKDWKSLSREELAKLIEKYPATTLATMFNVTSGAIYYRVRTYGLTLGQHKPGPKASFNPDKVTLEKLIQEKTMAEIADHFGVSEASVFTRLKQNGIIGPSRSDRLKNYVRSDEHNRKIAEKLKLRTGPLANNWKGGIATENNKERSRKEYKEWKLAVLKRDEFKCVVCGVEQGSICKCCGNKTLLHVHHIEPFAKNKKLRNAISNGESLCSKCHYLKHEGKI